MFLGCDFFQGIDTEDLIGNWLFIKIDEPLDLTDDNDTHFILDANNWRKQNFYQNELWQEFTGTYTFDKTSLLHLHRAERTFLREDILLTSGNLISESTHKVKLEDGLLTLIEISPKGNEIGSVVMNRISD